MSFGKRLKELRENNGLTQEELGERLNLKKAVISKYENDKLQPSIETISFLSDFFGVSIDYLFGRTNIKEIDIQEALEDNNTNIKAGDKPITPQQRLGIARILDNPDAVKTSSVPILGTIRAGIPILAEDNWEEQIEIPSHIVADFALRVTGDSMIYAGIHPGDIIICKHTNYANHGQIVAAGIADGDWQANLKFYIQNNGHALLRSANPEYEDIPLTQNHRIIGVMVAQLREDAPSVYDYQNLLRSKEYNDNKWTEIIETAAGGGVSPEFIKQFVESQIQMATMLAQKK